MVSFHPTGVTMSRLEFEVWRLGAVRHQDECLERYARMGDAIRAASTRRERDPNGSYEVRRLGVPFEQDQHTPPARRSTQPKMPAIRESSPSKLRSTHPMDDDEDDAALA